MLALRLKHAIVASCMLAFFTFSGYLQALTFDDAGDVDDLLDWGIVKNTSDIVLGDPTLLPNSGNPTLAEWIHLLTGDHVVANTYLGFDDDADQYVENITDSADTLAFAIDEADNFVIKTKTDAFLFDNEDLFSYAVFTLTDINLATIESISHIKPESNVVPIPAAAWLFGTALLGMIGVARRIT